MPEGAIYVGRGTRWGNPFRIGTPNTDDCMTCADAAEAVAKYRSEVTTFGDCVNFTGCKPIEIRNAPYRVRGEWFHDVDAIREHLNTAAEPWPPRR
jgi:hypothetical protein